MPATLTALFPNEPDAQYNVDYYVKQHMPLVQKLFGKFGLKSWTASKFVPGTDGSSPQYAFGSVVYWESVEAIKLAFSASVAAEVMNDVPNFSYKHPIFWVGETIKE